MSEEEPPLVAHEIVINKPNIAGHRKKRASMVHPDKSLLAQLERRDAAIAKELGLKPEPDQPQETVEDEPKT